MKKINYKKEWKILKEEIFSNRPKIEGPYPEEIIKAREYLLLAQVNLSNAEFANLNSNYILESIEYQRYKNVLRIYRRKMEKLKRYYDY